LPESDGVIVAKLDRFARTLVGALATLEQFERHGAVLVSVADNLDLSTAMGKAFLAHPARVRRARARTAAAIPGRWPRQTAIARGITHREVHALRL